MIAEERIKRASEILEIEESQLLDLLGIQKENLSLLDAPTTTKDVLKDILSKEYPKKSLAILSAVSILKTEDVPEEEPEPKEKPARVLIGDCPLCSQSLYKGYCRSCRISYERLDSEVVDFVLFLREKSDRKTLGRYKKTILSKIMPKGIKRLSKNFPEEYKKFKDR